MRKLTVPLWIFLLLVTIGCSGSGSENPAQPPQVSIRTLELGDGHSMLGYFDLFIDPASGEVTTVENRTVSPHVNVTGLLGDPGCPNSQCIYFILTGFDPFENLYSLDIYLMNPTNLSPFDPRVIFFTSNYPEDYDVRNADSWTTLFDPDTEFPDFVNPFIALGKDEMNNRRLPVFPFWVIERVELWINPVPVDPDASLSYVVEVNWPGRCKEPYEINNFQFLEPTVPHPEYESELQEKFSPNPGDGFTIACDVYDWQDDIVEVSFYAPDILGDSDWHPMQQDAGGPQEQWLVTFLDIVDVDRGEYETWFRAASDDPTDQVADVYQRYYFPVIYFDPGGTGGSPGEGLDPRFAYLQDNGGYSDIVIKNVIGGGGELVLFSNDSNWNETEEYSPSLYSKGQNNNYCLFASDKGGQMDLWSAHIVDSVVTAIPHTTDEWADFGPQIHPNYNGAGGNNPDWMDAVFYSYRNDGNAEIYAIDLDGSNQITRLTTNWAEDVDPCIYQSPTGQPFVAFASNRNGWDNYDIYVQDPLNLQIPPYRITFNSANDTHPSWSTSRPILEVEIVFSSNRNGDYDIFRWFFNTGMVFDVVVTENDQIDPHFSPNSQQIVYASDEGDSYDIWTCAADGKSREKRTFTSKDEWAPFWGWMNEPG